MFLNNTTSNKDSDVQYLVTFKCDYYSKLVINHELVRATDNAINEKEQEYIEESDKDTNIELQLMIKNTNTYKQVKGREGGQ
ncbi:8188_t:CDS:2, partial [Cetraspora pellucida]